MLSSSMGSEVFFTTDSAISGAGDDTFDFSASVSFSLLHDVKSKADNPVKIMNLCMTKDIMNLEKQHGFFVA